LFTVAIDQKSSVVLIKVTDVSPFKGMKNAVIEPNMTLLRGVHLHDLKIVDSVLKFKTQAEKDSMVLSKDFKYAGLSAFKVKHVIIRKDHRVTAALVALIFVMFGLAVYLK
jgi:hypothetical protein